MAKESISIFWHRRDLRLEDNAGLYHALKGEYPVLPLFIFDRNILDKLADTDDARVSFIHDNIKRLHQALAELGSSLKVIYCFPTEDWKNLLQEYDIKAVYTNRDYEPYAKQRDESVANLLAQENIPFHDFKDQVIFEKMEIQKKSGGPYTVFTPYSRQWRSRLSEEMITPGKGEKPISAYLQSYPNENHQDNYLQVDPMPVPSLEDMGFTRTNLGFPSKTVSQGLIKEYDKKRNFPAQKGTSHLGVHFRFGTISIREKARRALLLNQTFLNELIWRDFYAQILANFPHVEKRSFRPEYDFIEWRNDEQDYQAWCEGRTGYPIVDAGMRELNETGYMHNRVRMITASFLTKHLLIDWRWGEAYFARKLLDYELASNNGGWQWAAGSGTDAAPYFRIFNPYTQREKFDKDWTYVKKWVPEVNTRDYPQPIIEHKPARERCLATYKEGLDRGKAQKG
jgi:deoxyribodipyrimidine photo-lyase